MGSQSLTITQTTQPWRPCSASPLWLLSQWAQCQLKTPYPPALLEKSAYLSRHAPPSLNSSPGLKKPQTDRRRRPALDQQRDVLGRRPRRRRRHWRRHWLVEKPRRASLSHSIRAHARREWTTVLKPVSMRPVSLPR